MKKKKKNYKFKLDQNISTLIIISLLLIVVANIKQNDTVIIEKSPEAIESSLTQLLTKYSCALVLNKNSFIVGDTVVGTLAAKPNTNCDVKLNGLLAGSIKTNSEGRATKSVTAVDTGSYNIYANCGTCKTNTEYFTITSNQPAPAGQDTDGDGIPDTQDLDDDNDGYSDAWEQQAGTDPLDPNDVPEDYGGQLDWDGDGLTNEEEINNYGTDPNDADSDNDGIDDLTELQDGTDPLDPADPGSNPPALDCNQQCIYSGYDSGRGPYQDNTQCTVDESHILFNTQWCCCANTVPNCPSICDDEGYAHGYNGPCTGVYQTEQYLYSLADCCCGDTVQSEDTTCDDYCGTIWDASGICGTAGVPRQTDSNCYDPNWAYDLNNADADAWCAANTEYSHCCCYIT